MDDDRYAFWINKYSKEALDEYHISIEESYCPNIIYGNSLVREISTKKSSYDSIKVNKVN